MADPVQVTVQTVGTIGRLSEYQLGEDWNLYQERLDQYFLANIIPDDRKVPVLLTLIGNRAYKILRDLCDPVLPKDKSYIELCELLHKQFSPRSSVFRKRIDFYNLKQSNGETINNYFVRIKNAAMLCKFGNQLNEIIKDKFVSGLLPGRILDRVCEEDETQQLADLVELALKREESIKATTRNEADTYRLEQKKSVVKPVRNFQVKQSAGVQRSGELKCNRCGKGNHVFAKCKYKNYSCKNCKKVGHLATVCTASKNNYAEVEQSAEMYFVASSNNSLDPLTINLSINDRQLEMELDSGARRSVIPEKIFLKHFNTIRLQPTSTQLRTYQQVIIKPVGEFTAEVKFKNKRARCTFLVVTDGATCLLGRDLMKDLKMVITDENLTQANNFITVNNNLELDELLDKYSRLFKPELGCYKFETIHLELDQVVSPIFVKPRPVPFSFKERINTELDRLEKEGAITKVDNSVWGTPLVPVLKADGNVRICCDYKVTVNKFLKDVNYPLPRIEEIFVALQGGQHFTKLDILCAYNQLMLSEETKRLLAWSTHRGIYVPNRLPYGTKPACQIFQRVLEKVLQGVPGVVNFMDDVVVTGKNKLEHLQNLQSVFERLAEAGFTLNRKKCFFFQTSVAYLGHIIDKEGLHKDTTKVQAILKISRPTNLKEVRAFMGVINYYGKFIQNLATIVQPIYQLLKKDNVFNWTKSCETAFLQIRALVASNQSLTHFDPRIPLKLVCDSSEYGIGAVLAHVLSDGTEKPICFASRILNQTERNYAVIHKEALAIYWGVQKFSQYLMGNKFILCSDHKPLQAIFGEKKGIPQMAAGRLQRWALFLNGFDYQFQHIKGTANVIADTLSRLPRGKEEMPEMDYDYFHFLIEDKIPITSQMLRTELRRDSVLGKVCNFLRNGWPATVEQNLKPFFRIKHELHWEQDLLMWGYRVVIPEKFKQQLLEEVHGTHNGMIKMKMLARQYFWWPNLDKDIEDFVKSCHTCLSNSRNPERTRLIKFEETKAPFDRIHIDFAGPINGKTYLIITDSFSKWPEIYPMLKMDTDHTLQKLRDCFARFGLPNTIISDNGPQLVSDKFEQFCKINGIKHRTSAPFHPATNGAAENAVKTFKEALKKFAKLTDNSTEIHDYISRYLFSYRTTPHCSTGQTPATLMFKREIKTRLSTLTVPQSDGSRERQIKSYRGTREVQLEVGDKIYVKDFRDKPVKWVRAEIKEKLGQRNYLCSLDQNKATIWKRHLNQIILVGKMMDPEVEREQNFEEMQPIGLHPVINRDANTIASALLKRDISVGNKEEVSVESVKVEEVETDARVIEEKKTEPVKLVVSERPKRIIKAPDRLNL